MPRKGGVSPRLILILALALPLLPLPAARAPKLPADAPYCATPGTRPLFLSPMGEPFRAAPGQPYPAAVWFAGADRNHDGKLDRGEIIADARRFFAMLDHDHDGRLTPEEVIAYERDVAPEIALYKARGDDPRDRGHDAVLDDDAQRSTRSGRSSYTGAMGAGRYAWLNIPEPVAAADADIDRLVSADEFAAAAGRRFDVLDTKRLGSLAPADLPRTPQQASIEGPCRPRPEPRRRDRAMTPLPDEAPPQRD